MFVALENVLLFYAFDVATLLCFVLSYVWFLCITWSVLFVVFYCDSVWLVCLLSYVVVLSFCVVLCWCCIVDVFVCFIMLLCVFVDALRWCCLVLVVDYIVIDCMLCIVRFCLFGLFAVVSLGCCLWFLLCWGCLVVCCCLSLCYDIVLWVVSMRCCVIVVVYSIWCCMLVLMWLFVCVPCLCVWCYMNLLFCFDVALFLSFFLFGGVLLLCLFVCRVVLTIFRVWFVVVAYFVIMLWMPRVGVFVCFVLLVFVYLDCYLYYVLFCCCLGLFSNVLWC